MKCAACGWVNPASYTTCFNCHASLRTAPQRVAAEAQEAPQGVLAAPFLRFKATLIDAALMAGLAGAVVYFGSAWVDIHTQDGARWLLRLAVLSLLALCLPALMDAWSDEGSVGKRMMGIRVVTAQAQRPGVFRSLLRSLFKYGGHFAIPFVLRMVERLLLGPRYLHDAVARTHVVMRDASPDDVVRAAATQSQGHALGTALALLVTPVVLLVLGAVGYVLVQHQNVSDDAPADAAFAAHHQAVIDIWRAAQPLTVIVQNHHQRSGTFPMQASDELTLPPTLGTLTLEPGTGRLIIIASQAPIAGARIVVYPGVLQRLGEDRGHVEYWYCGSNLPEAQRPQECNSAVALDD